MAARWWTSLIVGLVCGVPARAQAPTILSGYVLDPSLAGVSGASVTIVNEDSGFRRATQSQADGEYVVRELAPGNYKITVRKEGFRTMIRFHVRVGRSEPARADFALSLGSMLETVTVEGAAPLIRRDDAAVATVLGQADMERLPVNGRGLLGLVEMGPGANIVPATRGDAGQFVADGQRPNTNSFTVDGVSANNGVAAGGVAAQTPGGTLPVMSAFGSLDSMAPLDSIQEFRIQTSSSQSEFGQLPGAVVAISSRSGSNEFHGSATFRFRHESLSANDWFANRAGKPRARSREQNGGLTLGGPLRRNRAFFFLAYERMALDQPFAWLDPVPSSAARYAAPEWLKPALNLFPEPTGPSLGDNLAAWNGRNWRPASLQGGSARVDQTLGTHATLFARYSDSLSTNEFGKFQVDRLDFRSWSATLGLNLRAGTETVFDFRINQSATSAASIWSGDAHCELLPVIKQFLQTAADCNLLVRFEISGVGQLVSGREGARRQRQFQFVQSGNWDRGPHELYFGTDYRQILPVRRDAADTLGLIVDGVQGMDDTANYWIARGPAQNSSVLVREISLWGHDNWHVSRRLSLLAGVRWELSPPPAVRGGVNFLDLSTGTVETEKRPLWRRPYGHFALRLGVTFSPGKSSRTVLRAGGGLYFDSSLSIATDVINSGPLSVDSFGGGRFAPFPSYLGFGFMPDLNLPHVWQWNFSVEHALSGHDVISVGYVGSRGRWLIRREVGGAGSTPTRWVALTTKNGASDYQGLVAQYRRQLARGVEGLVSYSWSHALDNDSSDTFLLWAGPQSTTARDRGSSDFDLRHSLTASFSYALPALARGWSLDGIFRARSGFPITILDADQYTGIPLINAFRPDVAPGISLWIADPSAPGGKRLNAEVFRPAGPGVQGNLGRNAFSGFGMAQVDLALRREFRMADRARLDVRLEAFNALNHPNFADPARYLNSALFGQSTSMLNQMLGTGSPGSGLSPLLQAGGARSVEAGVRVRF